MEKNLGVNASMEEIRKEIFEGNDIVTSNTDHGLSKLTNAPKNLENVVVKEEEE